MEISKPTYSKMKKGKVEKQLTKFKSTFQESNFIEKKNYFRVYS